MYKRKRLDECRPDSKADPKTLHPDILTPDGEDSLQVTLKYLASIK